MYAKESKPCLSKFLSEINDKVIVKYKNRNIGNHLYFDLAITIKVRDIPLVIWKAHSQVWDNFWPMKTLKQENFSFSRHLNICPDKYFRKTAWLELI